MTFGRPPGTVYAALLIMAATAGGGCAGKKEPTPFTGPALESAAGHFVGTALSGPTGAKPSAAPTLSDVSAVTVTFVALERMPWSAGSPLGAQARLIVADRAGGPIIPSPLLTREVRIADLPAAVDPSTALGSSVSGVRMSTFATLAGIALPDLTATFAVIEPVDAGVSAADQRRRRMEVGVRRTGGNPGEIEYSLLVDDELPKASPAGESSAVADPEPTGRPVDAPATRPALRRELALFGRPAAADGVQSLAVIIPARFESTQAIAAVVQVAPAPDDDPTRQRLAEAIAQANEAAETASNRPRVAPLAIAEIPGFAVSVAALGRPEARRAALAFLASRAGAAICEDLALVGDDAALAAMAERVEKNLSEFASAATVESFAWLLERTCLEMLAEQLDKGRLAPELEAVLTRNLGEAGRQTASIQEVVRVSGSLPALGSRVLAENMIFLEDASPSARVRAFDWLASRGRSPEGYDPLGAPRERRDALEKSRAAATAATVTGGKP